jgi:Flp pilus assembly protein TadD
VVSNAAQLHAQAEAYRRAGQLQLAEQTYRRALEVDATNPALHHQLGLVLGAQGKLEKAIVCFQTAVERNPNDAQALNNLGVALQRTGRLEEAALSCRRALQARPDYAEAHNNLGVVLQREGRLDEAVACSRRALELKPDYIEAHNSLGVALECQDKLDEAAACFREVLRLHPGFAEAYSNLAGVLDRQGKPDEALPMLKTALELNPNSPEALVNLGLVLEQLGRVDDALNSLRRAIALAPDVAQVTMNLGVILDRNRNLDAAADAFRRAIELDPDSAEAHFNYGLSLLRGGHFDAGWREYEWRAGLEGVNQPKFAQPRWKGEPLAGRTILLAEEQGRGDTLQFVRYAEPIKRQGATVIVRCRAELTSLIATCRGVDSVVPTRSVLPAFDFYLPLPSAPGVFHTSLESIPANVPYLRPDAALVRKWKERLDAAGEFKVGIAWNGSPTNKADRYRSIPLTWFAPLTGLPGVRLYSIQIGQGREQLASLTPPCPITDLADDVRDFHDTASIMSNLDLVIACDTAAVHLAGALGVAVWVCVAFVPDWRWMLGRSDSPWYPTLRLYRQARSGDWDTVFQHIQRDLAALAAGRTR